MTRSQTIVTSARSRLAALRVLPLPALISAAIALSLLAGAVIVVRLTGETTQEALRDLDAYAATQAATLDEVVAEATRDLRLASRNVIFGDALANGSGPVDALDRARVESALTYMGQRYRVDEICLIRSDGLEVSRFNGGHVAAVADLSPDESVNNPAFYPTLGLPDDENFRTSPYVSPDSGRWVLGLATPIVRDGTTIGILHLELPIAAMADAISAPFGTTGYSFTIDRTGHLLNHPRIASFREAAGLSTDPNSGDFPPANALGGRAWKTAIEGIISGTIPSGRFTDETGPVRFAARPILGEQAFVVSVSAEHELFAAVRAAQLDLLVTLGPLAALIVVLTAAFARRLAQTNRRLAMAVQIKRRARLDRGVGRGRHPVGRSRGTGRHLERSRRADLCVYGGSRRGRPLADLFGPERREEIARHLATVALGEPVEHYEVDSVRPERRQDRPVADLFAAAGIVRRPLAARP